MSNGNSGGGWNRPTSNQPVVKKNGAKTPSVFWVVVVGAVAVVVGIVCTIVFSGTSAKSEKEVGSKTARIKEVKPAKAQTNKVAIAKTEKPKELKPQQVGETRNGYVLLPSGKLYKVRPAITNHTMRIKSKCEIFKHDVENEISRLLWMKPGDVLVGTPNWKGRYTKDFLESLKEPIIVTQVDTPEQADIKRAVNEAKIELKAAYDRGEDIEKILLDTRADMQKLMRYKQDVREMVAQFRIEHPDASPDDVEDVCAAANKMLESKGIAPALTGPITRQKLIMMRRQERANQSNGSQNK